MAEQGDKKMEELEELMRKLEGLGYRAVKIDEAVIQTTTRGKSPLDAMTKEEKVSKIIEIVKSLKARSITEEKGLGDIKRDDVVKELIDSLNQSHELYTKDEKRHQGWKATSIFNGSGAGKTYLAFYFSELLGDYLRRHTEEFVKLRAYLREYRCLRVYHKQYNGTQMPTKEKDFIFFLLCTMVAQLAHSKQEETIESVDVIELIKRVDESGLREIFGDLDLIMAAIRRIQGKNIWILFSHDELQEFTTLTELDELQKNSLERKEIRIYQYIYTAMELAARHSTSTFIFNLFTGTFPLEVTKLLAPTQYEFKETRLYPIKPREGIDALKAKHPNCRIFDEELFKKFFELLGNVPRIWVAVGEIVKNYTSFHQKQMSELLDEARQITKRSYKIVPHFAGDVFYHALFVMVQRWDLQKLEKCENPSLIRSIQSLLFDGCLFSDATGRFFIPILFLYELSIDRPLSSPEHKIFVDFTKQALSGSFNSTSFEHFVINLYALKQHLFLRMQLTTPQVAEFFSGAYFGDSVTAERKMNLGAIPVELEYFHRSSIKALDKVPLRKGINEQEVDLTEARTAWAVHVGHTDPHQDAFLWMNDSKLLVLFEMKFTEQQAQKSLAQRSSTKKNKSSSSGVEYEFNKMKASPLMKSAETVYCVYFTNAKVTEKSDERERVVGRGCILVSAGEWSKALSGIFVLLRDYL